MTFLHFFCARILRKRERSIDLINSSPSHIFFQLLSGTEPDPGTIGVKLKIRDACATLITEVPTGFEPV